TRMPPTAPPQAPSYGLPTSTQPSQIRMVDPDTGDVMPLPSNSPGSDASGEPPTSLVVPTAPPNQGSGAPTVPDLPDRPPLPVPPAVSLIPPAGSGQPKQSLAWRTKAYKMQEDPGDGRVTSIRASKLIAADDNEAFGALVSALQKNGFAVDAICQPAGQLLAHSTDPALQKIRIVFVLKHSDPDHVVLKSGVDPESRAIKTKSLEDVLNQVQRSLENKDVL
ncbi:MAG TPA: hypothetical protein V6C72_04380, partial [Chroococcales cyanobacterium]